MKVTGLKNKIVDINKKVTSSVENYIKTKASAIAARFSLGAKVEGALKAAEAAQKALAIAQEAAFQLAEDAAEAAASVIGGAGSFLANLLPTPFREKLGQSSIPDIVKNVNKQVCGITDKFSNLIPDLSLPSIPGIPSGIINSVNTALSTSKNLTVGAAGAVEGTVDAAIAEGVGTVGLVVAGALNTVNGLLAVTGGVVNAMTGAFNTASNFMQNAIDFIKKFIPRGSEAADPVQESEGIIAEADSIPATNDNKSNTVQDLAQVQAAKTEADAQKAIETEAANGEIKMMTMGPAEMREQAQIYDAALGHRPGWEDIRERYMFLRPMSDEIASRWLAYTPDQATCDMERWKAAPQAFQIKSSGPSAIRNSMRYKIPEEITKLTDYAYLYLNADIYSNVSEEYHIERVTTPIGRTILDKYVAHDFHLAADTTFLSDHIPNLIKLIPPAVFAMYGLSTNNIKYLHPVDNKASYEQELYTVTSEEGVEITIDKKGNRVTNPVSAPDNSVLVPI